MNSLISDHADTLARIDAIVKEIVAERGTFADEGACWVTFSDGSQRCYRDLDAEGSDIFRQRSGLKIEFFAQRFCP